MAVAGAFGRLPRRVGAGAAAQDHAREAEPVVEAVGVRRAAGGGGGVGAGAVGSGGAVGVVAGRGAREGDEEGEDEKRASGPGGR